jgi:putative peptidoglycan lipid II flippase
MIRWDIIQGLMSKATNEAASAALNTAPGADSGGTASANRQIARAAGIVMLAFAIGNLVGLVRQILVAGAFGTSAEMDAFNAANRVSETLFNLVAGGALASAFIPTFTALLARGDKSRAWHLASAITNLLLVLLVLLTVLAAIFAPWIVHYVLAPGFASQPQVEALTVHLLRLMLPSAMIFALSGLAMGILNSHQHFFLPALAPTMYQIGIIIGVLFLAPNWGIDGLAWGVVLGALLHLLVQTPQLLRLGGHYSPTLDIRSADVWEVARLMGPRLLGVAVVQLNFWINTRLASGFAEGSVSALILSFSILLTPQSVIAQAIAIAAMPTFSAQAALGKLDEMRTSLAASLRGLLLLSIPASIGLMLLRIPLVTLLYQRGEFTSHSTELVAWALLWYAAGLVGHNLVEILARAFYALHDTKTPVFVGIAAMSLNVVFSYIFAALFLQIGWMPHGGLALANSLATGLEAAVLIIFIRRRLKGIEGRRILEAILQGGAAALVMMIALAIWLGYTSSAPAWLVGLGGVLLGGTVYGISILALGVSEVRGLVSFTLRRLRQ